MATGEVAAQPKPAGDVTRGEQVYRTFCWNCHGPYGRGDGPAAQYLAVRPPDFTDPALRGGKSDEQILARLTERRGRPDAKAHPMMVVVETVKAEALRDAIAYMRTLSVPGERVSLLAGRDIYNTFCQVCHGARGDGQGPAAENLVGVKPRDFTSPAHLPARPLAILRMEIASSATAISVGQSPSPERMRSGTSR